MSSTMRYLAGPLRAAAAPARAKLVTRAYVRIRAAIKRAALVLRTRGAPP